MRVLVLLITTGFLLASTGFAADTLSAPDKSPEAVKMQEKMKEMMAKMKAYATPGQPHKILSDMSGKWAYWI